MIKKYDNKGNVIFHEYITYHTDHIRYENTYICKDYFTYDDMNRMVLCETYRMNLETNIINYTDMINRYDKKGNEIYCKDPSGDEETCDYKYRSNRTKESCIDYKNGEFVRENKYNHKEGIVSTRYTDYILEYDKDKRQTKRTLKESGK